MVFLVRFELKFIVTGNFSILLIDLLTSPDCVFTEFVAPRTIFQCQETYLATCKSRYKSTFSTESYINSLRNGVGSGVITQVQSP